MSDKQLKDFIYLDIDRVRSFTAQLYEGVPEAFEESRGSEQTGGGDVGFNIPGLVKAGIKGDILFQKSTTETRSAHHHLYNLFEKELIKLEKLVIVDQDFDKSNWTAEGFEDGTFIMVQGKVQIIDYRSVVGVLQMIPRVATLVVGFKKQTLKEQLRLGKIGQKEYETQLKSSEISMPDKTVSQIAEAVEKFYSGIARVKVFPFSDNDKYRFVGNATQEYFSAAPNNPLVTSGLMSGENWFAMGLVNRPAALEPISSLSLGQETQQNIEDSLEQVVYAMQQISRFTLSIEFPAISIVPISIYRPC